jgi:hypothetical protein
VGQENALNAMGWNILYANTAGQYLSSAQVRNRAQMGKVLSLLPQNDLPDDVIFGIAMRVVQITFLHTLNKRR